MSPISPLTQQLVSLALDAATLRQGVHASNIAMANAPGHQAQAVSFEDHLEQVRDALASGRAPSMHHLAGAAAQVVPGESTAVRVDQEVASIARNAVHFQALTTLLSRHYGTLDVAIQGGR